MKRIKLVHVISSLKIGGAEALLVDLIRLMPLTTYEHHVIYFHDGPHRLRLAKLAISTHHITGGFCLYDPLFWWRLYRILKKLQPDVIHGTLWAANFGVRLLGKWLLEIPTITVLHWALDQDGPVRNALDRFTLNWADCIVAISDGVVESLVECSWAEQNKVQFIRNGVDSVQVQALSVVQAQTRESLGISADQIVVGTVGRFIPQKNYGQLLEMFARLHMKYSNIRLLLLGIGPLESALRSQAKKLGIEQEVIFVIGQPAYGYYPLMDCFVLPSFQEGLSIALLEAMACGVPSVTTGKVHPVIQHNCNGLLIEPGDKVGLYHELMRLVENKSLRDQLGSAGQKRVQDDFKLADTVMAYEELFKALPKQGKQV